MKKQKGRIGIAAFLMIIASTTHPQDYIKYFLLSVATISLVYGIYEYFNEYQENSIAKKSNHLKNL